MIGRWILVSIAVAGASCASARARPGRNQEVEWFRSGPYIGASVGVSNSAASASDLDADLAALGHTSSSTLDDTNEGWKFYTGYRFERPFSIEVGYVQLGEITSTITTTSTDLEDFNADVAAVHPFLGSGIFLAGQFSPLDRGPVEVGLRAGVWSWDADVESKSAQSGDIDVDADNVDPLLGLVVLIELSKWLELRLEYEQYYLDDSDAGFLSGGLQIRRAR